MRRDYQSSRKRVLFCPDLCRKLQTVFLLGCHPQQSVRPIIGVRRQCCIRMNKMAEGLAKHVPRGLSDQEQNCRTRLNQLLHGPGILVDAIPNDRVDGLAVSTQPLRPPVWRSTGDHVELSDILAYPKTRARMSLLSQKLLKILENRHHLQVILDRLCVDCYFVTTWNIQLGGEKVSA